jgi:hypothetical protein
MGVEVLVYSHFKKIKKLSVDNLVKKLSILNIYCG